MNGGVYRGNIDAMYWDFMLQFWSSRWGRLRYSKGIIASVSQTTILQLLEIKKVKKEEWGMGGSRKKI